MGAWGGTWEKSPLSEARITWLGDSAFHKAASSSVHSPIIPCIITKQPALTGHPGKYTEDKTWSQLWRVDAERDPGKRTRFGV